MRATGYLSSVVPTLRFVVPRWGWFCIAWLIAGIVPAEDSNPIDVIVQEFRSRSGEVDEPAGCSDSEFLRRACLDLTGYPPLPEEITAFERDSSAGKRKLLITRLVQSDRYSWKWGRWLTLQTGADDQELIYAASEMQCTTQDLFFAWLQWMQERVGRDEPYDKIVEDCVVATSREGRSGTQLYAELQSIADADQLQGTAYAARKTNDLFWRRYSSIYDPEFRAEDVAQRFLGIDVRCARCHDHPTEPLTQRDHQQFTAIFEPVRYSEVPFTQAQKKAILTTVVVLGGVLCLALVWGFSRTGPQGAGFRRWFVNALPTLAGLAIVAGTSYGHLLPGSPIQNRTSPGQLLVAGAQLMPLPIWPSTLLIIVIVCSLAFVIPLSCRRISVRKIARLSAAWLTPFLLMTLVDTGFVLRQDGDVVNRNGSIHALQHNVFRWLGVGGCGQQPREIYVSDSPSAYHVDAKLLNGPTFAATLPGTDLRKPLMEWLRDPSVPLLDQHFINLLWVEYFGEPLLSQTEYGGEFLGQAVSDSLDRQFRRALMSRLRGEFRSHQWSMRHLHAVILKSRLYSLSSQQMRDESRTTLLPCWFSCFPVRRLGVEQYLACVETATGSPLDFGSGYAPPRASAYQVASRYPFAEAFGSAAMRSLTSSPTDRAFSAEAAMFGLVEPTLRSQIRRADGWLLQSLREKPDIRVFIEHAFLRCFGRLPDVKETEALAAMRQENQSMDEFGSDLLWALLNSAESQFLF